MKARKLLWTALGVMFASACAFGQAPDLINALDAGGAAAGMGGSTHATSSNTQSGFYNPAALGYVNKKSFELVYGNLPTSRSIASGNYPNPNLSTTFDRGNRTITHAGIANQLFGKDGKPRGGWSLSYTVGGYLNDHEIANSLVAGSLTLNNYTLDRKLKTEFITLAYGREFSPGVAWGLGLDIVRSSLSVVETGTFVDSGNNVTPLDQNNSSDGANGIGGTIGLLLTPKDSGNTTLGFSYRSEIKLHNNTDTSGLMSKIPARFIAGLASRSDNLKGGKDYAVFGAEYQHYFEGDRNAYIDQGQQNVFGIGVEYNRFNGDVRIPFRLGYRAVQAGGDTFGARNAVTFGVGYHPVHGRFGLDIDFATPQHGGTDLNFGLVFKLDK